MKIKIQKRKFIRNIVISIIALFIVAFIINIAPGYKRNKYKNVTNLVIGDTNVTENLKNPIYRDEDGTIYLSKEDIKTFLDKTIYYDKENNIVILTSEVTVASMEIGNKIKNIDGVSKDMLHTIIYKDDIMYIPLDEIKTIYNIETKYIEESDIVIIDKLNKGMIKAEAEEETKIRYKQRTLSKEVGNLSVGEKVSAFYTTSKGWRLIRTEDGIVGYVKANKLTNEYILRQDMEQETETKTININVQDGEIFEIENQKIVIKDLLELTEDGILIKNTAFNESDSNVQIWANLTINNTNINDFNNRIKIIKNIANISRKNNIAGINIYLTENQNIERFVIELAPKLREIGIITNVITSENINEETYTNIVNYIINI